MIRKRIIPLLVAFASIFFIALWIFVVIFEILYSEERAQLKGLYGQKVSFNLSPKLQKTVAEVPQKKSTKARIALLVDINKEYDLQENIDSFPKEAFFILSYSDKDLNHKISLLKAKRFKYLINLSLLSKDEYVGDFDFHKNMTTNEITHRLEKLHNQCLGCKGFYNIGKNEDFLENREAIEALVKKVHSLNSILIYGINNKTSVLEPYGDLAFSVNAVDLSIESDDSIGVFQKLQELSILARKRGKAILVLKASSSSVEVLKKWKKDFDSDGLEFVNLKDLVMGNIKNEN